MTRPPIFSDALRRHGVCEIRRKRQAALAGCFALAIVAAPWQAAFARQEPAPASTASQPAAPATPVEASGAAHQAAAPAPAAGDAAHQPAAGHETGGDHAAAETHEESPWGLIARIFNFAVLVGLLGYFLRGPFGQHLASRKQQIASDLVSARETTNRAQQQLTDIDRRLKELPAELETLKAAGAEEVAAEGARIRQAAETERQRLLEQTRREIDMQLRIAKQALTEHTADLAVELAKDRLSASITPDDQDRFVDQYVSQVKEFHG